MGWVLVVGLTYLVVTGLLLDGLVSVADKAFSVRDTTTPEGVHQPTTGLRSGGPGSVVPWDSLGYEGRTFTGLGPSPADIEKVTHHRAVEPVRSYAGLASGPDAESRAALAVQDLQRAGGFQRKNLLVVTTTGSGWVDPAMVDTFEYLTHGDAATVAIQYSYLPSWISYLVDQSKAREAGRALFDAVYDPWSKLPAGQRPRLFVAGESLGSFGGETAFSGEYDLRNRTNGTLFAGPPNFNTLFREFSDHRAPGSPEIQPVYKDGRTVRFANDAGTAIPPQGSPWQGSRVLYLMHPSDPIVWWSPSLILGKPAWTNEAPGKDVLAQVVWIPFVTFWQVTADLPFSTGVPPGHGHKYTGEYVDGWAAVMQPADATPEELAAIRSVVINLGLGLSAAGALSGQPLVGDGPGGHQREPVGGDVGQDRRHQAPRPQPQPREGEARHEGHGDRPGHQGHPPCHLRRRRTHRAVVGHGLQGRLDVPQPEQERRDPDGASWPPERRRRPQQHSSERELLRDGGQQGHGHGQLVQQPPAGDVAARVVEHRLRQRHHGGHQDHEPDGPEGGGAVPDPRGHGRPLQPEVGGEAPDHQATSASTVVTTATDTLGRPASPSPRTRLKTTRTATACRKHRRGLVTEG